MLERLAEPQREIIALAFYGGRTRTHIADPLELPAVTVKGRMRLGLREPRDAIEAPPVGDNAPQ